MRIALLTDVHANLAALQAVLRHAEEDGPLDQVWCMGDLVGYGPQPSECLTVLRGYDLRAVAGNHDRAATGDLDTSAFNPAAAEAAGWTETHITNDDRAFLRELPEVRVEGEMTLVHGSLRDPVWEYLFDPRAARGHLDRQDTPYSVCGHTHIPLLFEEAPGRSSPLMATLAHGDRIELGERRLVINPGGVGQPRDGDPRSAYGLLDTAARTVDLFRVEYDITATQRAMEDAGLPERLITRLARGK